MSPYPAGIRDRHIDVGSRPWGRWIAVACLTALPLLAVLNVFGQHPTTTRAASPVADVTVTAPTRLRSGLQFQVRVEVAAHRTVRHLALGFSSGWWDSMGANSIEPQPSSETSHDGLVVLDMGVVPAGQTLTTWLNFTVNPTHLGTESENLVVADGSHTLVRIHRSLTVFP
jgi:hypothetical protein